MNSSPRMLTVSMPEKSTSEGSVMSCHKIKRVFSVFCLSFVLPANGGRGNWSSH